LTASRTNEVDADKTVWVDPGRITYSSLKEFDIYRDKGRVIGGDWDRLEKRFEEGEKLHSEGKFKEAAAVYREVLDKLPKHEGAHERLKQCYLDMERTGERPKMIKKAASPRDVLLLEQKYAAAVSLYEEDQTDEALKKFKEVVEMITFSRTNIDTKDILPKAREYIEKIKIEKQLEDKQPAKEESKEQPKPVEDKKPANGEKKDVEKPEQPKKREEPEPGGIAPH